MLKFEWLLDFWVWRSIGWSRLSQIGLSTSPMAWKRRRSVRYRPESHKECSGAVLFASEVVAVSHPIPRGAISSVRRWPHDLLVTRSQGFWSHKQQTVAIVQPGADDGSGNHRLLAALKLIGWVTLDSTLTFNQQHESNAVSACRYHSVRCS